MSGKRNSVDDREGLLAWAESVSGVGCMVCGRPSPDWRGWNVHHIMPGRCGRSDEACNLLFVDAICHDLLEQHQIRNPKTKKLLQTIPLGLAITLKLIRNHDDWDRERLAILHGTRLPLLLPIPAWIENEYRRNHPSPFRPWRPEHVKVIASVNEWIESYQIHR